MEGSHSGASICGCRDVCWTTGQYWPGVEIAWTIKKSVRSTFLASINLSIDQVKLIANPLANVMFHGQMLSIRNRICFSMVMDVKNPMV